MIWVVIPVVLSLLSGYMIYVFSLKAYRLPAELENCIPQDHLHLKKANRFLRLAAIAPAVAATVILIVIIYFWNYAEGFDQKWFERYVGLLVLGAAGYLGKLHAEYHGRQIYLTWFCAKRGIGLHNPQFED
jgi:hypothetical protein